MSQTTLSIQPDVASRITQCQAARLAALRDWDFEPLKRRCERQLGWNSAQAQSALDGYLQFLALLSLDATKPYAVPGDVDDVWHNHIIDTRDYEALCSRVVGTFVHHEPDMGGTRSGTDPYLDNTLANLNRIFGSAVASAWPPAEAAAKLAKCCNGHVGATN